MPGSGFRGRFVRCAPRRGASTPCPGLQGLLGPTIRAVEQTLTALLALGTLRDYVQVKAVVQPEAIVIPACGLPPPDLTVYDACLAATGGAQ